MKQYITIGTQNIGEDVFRKILRPSFKYFYKPNGGLWSSEFISKLYCISQWHDYLLYESPETAAYKDIESGALFTLKENANILTIESKEKIIELAKQYPSYHYMLIHNDIENTLKIIDYEALSKDYDGIYVSFNKLSYNNIASTFNSWSVDTLLLFNLDCIKEYQSVKIIVSPFPYETPPYVKEISSPKQILKHSDYYEEVYNYVREIFNNLLLEANYTFNNYQDYYDTIIEITEKSILLAEHAQKQNIDRINKRLQENDIKINNKRLITNITYNYLSEYLQQKKDKEKAFIKALKK